MLKKTNAGIRRMVVRLTIIVLTAKMMPPRARSTLKMTRTIGVNAESVGFGGSMRGVCSIGVVVASSIIKVSIAKNSVNVKAGGEILRLVKIGVVR